MPNRITRDSEGSLSITSAYADRGKKKRITKDINNNLSIDSNLLEQHNAPFRG
jgi:hypothetical protein